MNNPQGSNPYQRNQSEPQPKKPEDHTLADAFIPIQVLPEEYTEQIENQKKEYIENAKNEQKKIQQLAANLKQDKAMVSGNFLGKIIKLTMFLTLVSTICLFFSAIIYFAGIDTSVIPITLQGHVTDIDSKQPIFKAKVYVDGQEKTFSNLQGNFTITNLKPGKVKIKLEADEYNTSEVEVDIFRTFLNYTVKSDFQLGLKSVTVLKGKLKHELNNYSYKDDVLTIGETKVTINPDGTFEYRKIPTGDQSLTFTSPSFKDVKKKIKIVDGENVLDDIVLEPSAEIDGELISYVREDIVATAQVIIENVLPENIIVEPTGAFRVVDLEVGRTYGVRIQAPGYVTKDYSLVANQGKNFLSDFKLIENGKNIFVAKFAEDKAYQLYISDLDGSNQQRLTNNNQLDPQNIYYSESENKVYYQTQVDNVASTFSGRTYQIHSINLSNFQSIRESVGLTGKIFPSYKSKRAVTIEGDLKDRNKRLLYVSDINGNSKRLLLTLAKGEISQLKVSDSGEWAYYIKKTDSDYGLYKINLNTGVETKITDRSDITLYSVSFSGERALFIAKNVSASFKDLLLYNSSTSEIRVLTTNATGKEYQFFQNTEDQIIYWEEKSAETNIFKLELATNKTTQITNINRDEKITYMYQQSKYIYYKTSRALYILDLTKPQNLKQSTTGDIVSRVAAVTN